ncbi:hypothetical protein [Leifsonia shinshuensis]|uniref:hypothetical protein n=1 Tax=Leifsonia shinshuensis TaxID=150026 RepID=UPI00285E3E35|nr:hypothetical protein [Leifsonia shinshuensis]MDR6973072.1 hypothetical protein [Leifsonia shinshuensis]
MWDTTTRVPFSASLLGERSDADGRRRLLALIAECPGITVDELAALGLPSLFSDLRSFHRDGLIATEPSPPRFFERATRVYPAPA